MLINLQYGSYRPQHSCGKVMFSWASVGHSVHGGGSVSGHVTFPGVGTHPSPEMGTRPLLGVPSRIHGPGILQDMVDKRAVRILLEVVAKVIFLHLSVILFTGGCLPQCMVGYHPLPLSRHPPSRHTPPSRHPPLEQTPTWSRHQLGADTTLQEQTPPWSRPAPSPRADTPQEQTPPGAFTHSKTEMFHDGINMTSDPVTK